MFNLFDQRLIKILSKSGFGQLNFPFFIFKLQMKSFSSFYHDLIENNNNNALSDIQKRIKNKSIGNLSELVSLSLFLQSKTLEMFNKIDLPNFVKQTNERLNIIERKVDDLYHKIQFQMPNPDINELSECEYKMLKLCQEFSHIKFQNDPKSACSIGNLPLLKFTVSQQSNDYNIRNHSELLTSAFDSYSYPGATREQKQSVINYLIDQGISLIYQNPYDQKTILHSAIEKNKKDLIQILSQQNDFQQLLQLKDRSGTTPLLLACKRNDVDTVRLLLEKGANPNSIDKDKKNGLWLTSNPEITKMLLDHGIRVIKNNGISLLHRYIDENSHQTEQSMIVLLQSGKINVDEPEDRGYTPLKSACMKNRANFCKILLQFGANRNHRCLSDEDKNYLTNLIIIN